MQQNILLAYSKATACSCCSASWLGGGGWCVTSFWLSVGDIRCVAPGCCRWSTRPPDLPLWGLWSQTAQQRRNTFVHKQSWCLRLPRRSTLWRDWNDFEGLFLHAVIFSARLIAGFTFYTIILSSPFLHFMCQTVKLNYEATFAI